MFFKGSRYESAETATYIAPDGREITYVRLRLIPPTEPVTTYEVQRGDRPDLVADDAFGDPERFWRLCDANTSVWPNTLTEEEGRRIGVPTSS
ncbi:MAG: hypothetical protein R3B57_03520 [Phycisphaerales bacterium]